MHTAPPAAHSQQLQELKIELMIHLILKGFNSIFYVFILFLTALQRTSQKGQSTKSFWWVPVSCWKPRSTPFDLKVEWMKVELL